MNMRERIARAIGKGIDIADPMVSGAVEERDLFDAADAVLDAMTEPTEAMVEAGALAPMPDDYWAATILEQGRISALARWQAMIDAAKSESPLP